jgi:RimJ/RimL family protein N-acetyltransferase
MNDSISLRPLRTDDAEWIFDACQDLEIQKWTQIPRPYTREHAADFVMTLAGDVEVWVVENQSTGQALGVVGIHSINPITRVADIGYWMSHQGRGQGAMKKAIALLLEKLQDNPDVAYVEATIAEENLASRKTAESVGFILLGAADKGCNCGGEIVSAVLYQYALKASPLQNLSLNPR